MSAAETQQVDFKPGPIHQNRFVRRLLATSWIEPGSVFAASVAIYVLVPALWAFLDGNLVGHNGVDAFLTARNSYVFAIPFVFAAIAAYYRDTSDVLDRLMGCKTLERSGPWPPDFLEQVKSAPWSRALSVAVTITALATPTLFLLNRFHPAEKTWLFSTLRTPRPLALYFVPLFHGLGIYIIASWVLLHLRASAVLRKIFKPDSGFKLNLVILHPDKCMGLGSIGDMVKNVAVVLISLGFVFFMWQVGVFYSNWAGPSPLASLMKNLQELQSGSMHTPVLPTVGMLAAWFGFCIFSPLVFFLPLTSAKQAMAALKREKLLELGAGIVDSTNPDQAVKLSKQYRQVQKARVWPFNIKTVASFAATLGTPVVVAVLTEIAKKVVP